jgi:hypothetical protein
MNNVPDDVYIQNIKKIGNKKSNIHIVENFLNNQEISILHSEAMKDIYDENTNSQWLGRITDQKRLSKESVSILKLAHQKILEIAKNFYDVDLQFGSIYEGLAIRKWPTGSSMGEHIDDFASFHYNIASLIYINDNYEGGEIKFVDHDLTIKPKSGTLILFPGNKYYSHEVLEVRSGERYTSSFWFKFARSSFVGMGRGLGMKSLEDWKNIPWEDNIEKWRKDEN